jgi:LacI family transcriptional regulator
MSTPDRAILVVAEPESGREFQYGVQEFAAAAGWRSLVVVPWALGEQGLFPEGKFDGAIIQIRNPSMLTAAQALGCPLVNTSSTIGDLGFDSCWVNNHEIGCLAARHLLEHGARHFAFVGADVFFSKERQAGFVAELEARGERLRPGRIFNIDDFLSRAESGLFEELPSALGIFCANDWVGARTMRECLQRGRNVPNDMAIIGCDNDPRYTHQNVPALSSVEIPSRPSGRLAAEMLLRLIEGKANTPRIQTCAPLSVVTRGSTDVMMVSDPQITQALQILRSHGGLLLGVTDLARKLSMTRRTLHRRFLAAMRKPPADYIRYLRIERAKELLAGRTFSLEEIAFEVGYKTQAHFSSAFLQASGLRPSAYRNSIQAGTTTTARRNQS